MCAITKIISKLAWVTVGMLIYPAAWQHPLTQARRPRSQPLLYPCADSWILWVIDQKMQPFSRSSIILTE